MSVAIADVELARGVVSPVIHRTPLLSSRVFISA